METKPEQYRVYLSNAGKIRNRAEAYLVAYTKELLAEPVTHTIEQIHLHLVDELAQYCAAHPTHGRCRVSDIHIRSTVMGKPHLVTRGLGIYGPGRGIFTLAIAETVTKDASNGYRAA